MPNFGEETIKSMATFVKASSEGQSQWQLSIPSSFCVTIKIGRVYSLLYLVCVSFSSILHFLTSSWKGSGFGPKLKDSVVSLLWQSFETGIKDIPTCLQLIIDFQINGNFNSVFGLAEPVATVCPLVTFRYVKNIEDEFFPAFGVRVFQCILILFTTFRQGFTFVVKLPKQFFRTIIIIVNPAWQAGVRRFGRTNLKWAWAFYWWTCVKMRKKEFLMNT